MLVAKSEQQETLKSSEVSGEEVCLMHLHQRKKAHTLSILDKEKELTPWCVLFQ